MRTDRQFRLCARIVLWYWLGLMVVGSIASFVLEPWRNWSVLALAWSIALFIWWYRRMGWLEDRVVRAMQSLLRCLEE
jgi:hypothetical protein